MKRMLPLLLALLLLTACGTAPAAPPPTEEPVIEDEAPAAPTEAPGTDDTPAPVEEGEEAPAAPVLSETFVTLDGISSYLRLTLPEGWTWEQAGGTVDGAVYALYPENDPDFKVELRLWSDGFGMCGTGVSFQDYILPDGRRAELATEQIGGSLSWTLILPPAPDAFTIQFCAETPAYEAHRAELELLLSTLDQGILAGLDPVKPVDETR